MPHVRHLSPDTILDSSYELTAVVLFYSLIRPESVAADKRRRESANEHDEYITMAATPDEVT